MGRKPEQLTGNALVNGHLPLLLHQVGGIARQVVEPVAAAGQDTHEQQDEHGSRHARAAGHLAAALLGQAGHIHHDDGHVVVAPQAVGLVHQLGRAALRVARAGENLLDLRVFQHRGQAV